MIIPPIADHQLFKGYADGSLRFAEASWGPYLQQLRTDRGETLLHLTSEPATLSALLAVGLDPNARDRDGRTPLMRYRSAAANRVLIEGGAFPNEVDSMGQTALDYQSGALDGSFGYCAPDFEALEALLEGGAEPPSKFRAELWLENARRQVSAAIEANEYANFEAWVERHRRKE